jgi:hypothetical protein
MPRHFAVLVRNAATMVVRMSTNANLIASAGLVPALRLAERAGLFDLVNERVRVPGSAGANPGLKVGSIVAGMLTGADSIDDLDVVRDGGMEAAANPGSEFGYEDVPGDVLRMLAQAIEIGYLTALRDVRNGDFDDQLNK